MKRIINEMKLRLTARGENESVCGAIISAFVAVLDPTIDELCDLRCAVSEAVTNCVVHAYPEGVAIEHNYIYISVRLYDTREVTVEISDRGVGIENVALARVPAYTTGEASERCGMGFLIMESFTDAMTVKSKPGRGTTVLLKKILKP